MNTPSVYKNTISLLLGASLAAAQFLATTPAYAQDPAIAAAPVAAPKASIAAVAPASQGGQPIFASSPDRIQGIPLLAGWTYKGYSPKGDEILMAVHLLPGRAGSFLALLITDCGRHGDVYVVDPEGDSMYAMTPVLATSLDSNPMANDNPTLTLQIGGETDSKGRPAMTLQPANSGNKHGYQETARFEKGNTKDHREWNDYSPVEFDTALVWPETRVQLSPMNEFSREASGSVVGVPIGEIQGAIYLREKVPGVYLVTHTQVTDTGKHVSNTVIGIAVFVNRALVLIGNDGQVLKRLIHY